MSPTAAKCLQHIFCLLPKQTCAPWASFVYYGAPIGSWGKKITTCRLFYWVSGCCKMSPVSPVAYYPSRPVPHGARLSLVELPLVPVVQNYMCRLCRLFNVCRQLLQNVFSISFAYYPSRLVPPGAHLSFVELPLVPEVRNQHMSTLL